MMYVMKNMIKSVSLLFIEKRIYGITLIEYIACVGARRKDIVEIMRRDLLTLCAGMNFCCVGTYMSHLQHQCHLMKHEIR